MRIHDKPIRGQAMNSQIPKWIKNTYKCLQVYYDSATMLKNIPQICYELTTIFFNVEIMAKILNNSKHLSRILDRSRFERTYYE